MVNHSATETTWVLPGSITPEQREEQKKHSPLMRGLGFLFDFLQSIAMGGAFFVVVYLFVVQPHQVKGKSMYPTYDSAEYILTNKISYKFRLPARGEVIILESPKNKDIDFIKRIIALPGEHIRIENGKIYVNGTLFTEPYLNVETPLFPGGFMREGLEVTVPENNYFVMGDNRPGSSDSREFGFVPFENIIGQVVFRYFPPSRIGWIQTPEYTR